MNQYYSPEKAMESANTLNLAFLGDCVYELYVRDTLVRCYPDKPAREIHRLATELVCAKAQAKVAAHIFDWLDEEEKTVYLRARNAHPGHLPKNAAPADYHAATAIEAVVGYLYLCGKNERLAELFEQSGLFPVEGT